MSPLALPHWLLPFAGLFLFLALGCFQKESDVSSGDHHFQKVSSFPSHSEGSDASLSSIQAEVHRLYDLCEGDMPCYKIALEGIVKDQGLDQALQIIEGIAPKDPQALSEAHNLTHHAGRVAYQHLQDVSLAMAHCSALYQSGCYHGVLEEYLSQKPEVFPTDVRVICGQNLEEEKGRFAFFNCLHGLGHGLTMYVKHDLRNALTLCDALASLWERDSCYGGVFMEHVVTATRGRHQHGGGDHGKLLNPDDPQYPCSAIDQKYWRECYMMQTAIMLHVTQYDFAEAFRLCDQAPESMIPTCYQSMGRDIAGFTLRKIHPSVDLCQRGGSRYRDKCYVGVVKNFLNVTGEASDDAFQFCRTVPAKSKGSCYFAIGEELVTLFSESERRREACARTEASYVQDCHRGARIL